MNKIKALKEERGRLLGELSTLQTTIEREARSMADTETNRLSEIEARLGAIKAEVETLEKLQNLAAQAAGHSASRSEEKEKNEILKKILVPVKRFMVDWTAFDTHIVNGKIEMEEYPKLIETLEKFENPQLVNHSVVDHNSISHPSLTNRILFLNRNLKP